MTSNNYCGKWNAFMGSTKTPTHRQGQRERETETERDREEEILVSLQRQSQNRVWTLTITVSQLIARWHAMQIVPLCVDKTADMVTSSVTTPCRKAAQQWSTVQVQGLWAQHSSWCITYDVVNLEDLQHLQLSLSLSLCIGHNIVGT